MWGRSWGRNEKERVESSSEFGLSPWEWREASLYLSKFNGSHSKRRIDARTKGIDPVRRLCEYEPLNLKGYAGKAAAAAVAVAS